MIIFDLDRTLSDCEHRRHFVDPKKNSNYKRRWDATLDECINNKCIPEEYIPVETTKKECLDCTYKKFKPDWQAFYEACDQDKPILHTVDLYIVLMFDCLKTERIIPRTIEIWSGRCESVREKTEEWLCQIGLEWCELKMRPIGDNTSDAQLKEKWYDLHNVENPRQNIEFVFESDPKSIEMWRRRGVFVFDVNQSGEEF